MASCPRPTCPPPFLMHSPLPKLLSPTPTPTPQASTSQLFLIPVAHQSTPVKSPSETALLAWQVSSWAAGSLAGGAQTMSHSRASARAGVIGCADSGPGQGRYIDKESFQVLFPEYKSWVSSDRFPWFFPCSLCVNGLRTSTLINMSK